MSTTRVVLVEKHEVVRRGLAELVDGAADLSVAGTAATTAEAEPLLAAGGVDLVLVDVQPHDGQAVIACRALRSRHPDLPCVLLTSGDDEGLRAAVLAGAVGHVSKQVGGSTLLDGLRAAAAGRTGLDPAITAPLLARLRARWPGRPGSVLDEHQQQVLQLIGLGATDAEIADKLELPEPVVVREIADLVTRLGPPPSGAHGPTSGGRDATPEAR